jgi:hypothetical protein
VATIFCEAFRVDPLRKILRDLFWTAAVVRLMKEGFLFDAFDVGVLTITCPALKIKYYNRNIIFGRNYTYKGSSLFEMVTVPVEVIEMLEEVEPKNRRPFVNVPFSVLKLYKFMDLFIVFIL